MTDNEKRLVAFCGMFGDCNTCPFREECNNFWGKYDISPYKAYQKWREINERNT